MQNDDLLVSIVITGCGQSIPSIELERLSKSIGKALPQFLVGAFLAVDARLFVDARLLGLSLHVQQQPAHGTGPFS